MGLNESFFCFFPPCLLTHISIKLSHAKSINCKFKSGALQESNMVNVSLHA